MRNANGSGSVYKLQGKRRKPWICVITTAYSTDGKQIRKSLGTYETKKDAQIALAEYNKNPYLITDYTFLNIYEQYKSVNSVHWTDRTKKNCERIMTKLFPFHHRGINDIPIHEWQAFFSSLDLSYNYKKNVKWVVSGVYNFAEKYNFIQSNKTRLIDLGKRETVIERKIFTKEEIEYLFENVKPTKNINIYACLCILIYTGLRVGELLALKKEDVNLKERWLRVLESKTEAGKRLVPIHKRIIPIFEMLMDSPEHKEYVVTSQFSRKEIDYDSFRRAFGNFKTKNNLYHTIHDTRHTFATLLNNSNANPTSIKKIIGHTDFAFTEKVYVHKDLEELTKAIDLL